MTAESFGWDWPQYVGLRRSISRRDIVGIRIIGYVENCGKADYFGARARYAAVAYLPNGAEEVCGDWHSFAAARAALIKFDKAFGRVQRLLIRFA